MGRRRITVHKEAVDEVIGALRTSLSGIDDALSELELEMQRLSAHWTGDASAAYRAAHAAWDRDLRALRLIAGRVVDAAGVATAGLSDIDAINAGAWR